MTLILKILISCSVLAVPVKSKTDEYIYAAKVLPGTKMALDFLHENNIKLLNMRRAVHPNLLAGLLPMSKAVTYSYAHHYTPVNYYERCENCTDDGKKEPGNCINSWYYCLWVGYAKMDKRALWDWEKTTTTTPPPPMLDTTVDSDDENDRIEARMAYLKWLRTWGWLPWNWGHSAIYIFGQEY